MGRRRGRQELVRAPEVASLVPSDPERDGRRHPAIEDLRGPRLLNEGTIRGVPLNALSKRSCDMRSQVFTGAALAAVGIGFLLGGPAFERAAVAQGQTSSAKPVLPVFEVDAHFPTMPGRMLLGGVGGATADSHGNVWVLHRPHTLEEDNETLNGSLPAPPVVAFSPAGKYLQGWGGPMKGQYEWFNRGGLFSAHVECQSCT